MSLIVRMRRQRAVWWQRVETPNKYGEFTFNPPVEVRCRWEDVAVEFVDPKSEKQISRSLVYVDRVMTPGDRLKLGELSETDWILETGFWSDSGIWVDDALWIDSLSTVTIDEDSFEIRRFDQTPNLRNTRTLLTAYL